MITCGLMGRGPDMDPCRSRLSQTGTACHGALWRFSKSLRLEELSCGKRASQSTRTAEGLSWCKRRTPRLQLASTIVHRSWDRTKQGQHTRKRVPWSEQVSFEVIYMRCWQCTCEATTMNNRHASRHHGDFHLPREPPVCRRYWPE